MNRPLTSELISQLHSGALTARQLVESSLNRISELNGTLNAFVAVDAEGALTRADEIDQKRKSGKPLGRLAGLPMGVKDNMCTLGIRKIDRQPAAVACCRTFALRMMRT